MSGRIYKKHLKRKKIAEKYLREGVHYWGYGYSDEYTAYFDVQLNRKLYFQKRKDNLSKIKDLSFYEIMEIEVKHRNLLAQKSIDTSRWQKSSRFLKRIKRKYTVKRRQTSKMLELYAMNEDEVRFEAICPEGFKGCVAWEIW